MNISTVAKVWLFGLLTSIALIVTEAAFNQITVKDDGVIFRVRRFDDAREKLYRLVIKTDIISIFVIKFGGRVASFMAGPENFLVEFSADDGNLADVVPIPHGDPMNLSDPTVPLDYACNDCEEAWNDVCLSAETFICALVGHPIFTTTDSQDTLNIACNQFVMLCERLNAEAACSGNCVEGMREK